MQVIDILNKDAGYKSKNSRKWVKNFFREYE